MTTQLPTKDIQPVQLRRAGMADMWMVYDWQCEPETRRFARNPQAPTRDDHQQWFMARLSALDCVLAIILHGGEPAGVLRFDRKSLGKWEAWEVSILVAPGKKQLGIGSAALQLGRQLMPDVELVAEILPDNEASHRLFRKAGYVREADGLYHARPQKAGG